MYQCPSCGGGLKFHIASQQLSCENCDSKYDPYEITKEQDAEESTYYEATVFQCPQCGGEIVSSDNTAANFCSFCGASTILTSQLRKEKRPDHIIPFAITKQQCKEAYAKKVRGFIFASKELKDPKYVEEFRGIYMPYWCYDVTEQGPVSLSGSRSRRRGDYIYTDHYRLRGDMDMAYKGISFDASSSFDDSISQRIAPYDVKGMKSFTPSYLSGFYADTADVDSDVYANQAKEIADSESADFIRRKNRSFDFDDSTGELAARMGSKVSNVDGAMFPVWFMSYRKNNRVAYATVNGQTGKVVADLPISVSRYLIGSALLAIPIYILLNMLFTFRPETSLSLSALLCAVSVILYAIQMAQIVKKDSKIGDLGNEYAMNQNATVRRYGNRSAMGYSSRRSKPKSSLLNLGTIFSLLATLLPLYFIFIMMYRPFAVVSIYSGLAAGSSFNLGKGLVVYVCTIVGVIGWLVSAVSQRKVNKAIPGTAFSVVALIISSIICFFNPAHDMFYYGAMIMSLITVLYSLVCLLRYYNVLVTTKLPQFDNYRGGDHRA